jgi:adenylate cyclase, class 2
MNWVNVEIKAKCKDISAIEQLLNELNADYKGVDHQIDTYFNVPSGRLKLREGNIEHALIQYDRGNQKGPKKSTINYYEPHRDKGLKETLTAAVGILVVVDKKRQIFFIDNVKFHLDRVEGLGTFAEIEAIDKEGTYTLEALEAQCQHYMKLFGIEKEALIANSYSDLLLAQ